MILTSLHSSGSCGDKGACALKYQYGIRATPNRLILDRWRRKIFYFETDGCEHAGVSPLLIVIPLA